MKNLCNQRFGRLVVIEFSRRYNKSQCYWKCRCDCGKTKEILSGNLLTGKSTSCGYCVKGFWKAKQ